jgi:hypothetical protein
MAVGPSGMTATSPVERWYSVHQHGADLCLSPGWPTKDEAIATGHMKAGKFLGVICSSWLHPSASAASSEPKRAAVDPQDAELTTRVAEALYASNALCVGDDGQTLLEFTEIAKLKPHLYELLLIDARAAIQAMAEALR